MTLTMRITRAIDTSTGTEADTPARDLKVVLDLIDEAREWLPTKGPDQWATPYPKPHGKLAQVRQGIKRGNTWIVWSEDTPAATVTLSARRNKHVWTKDSTSCDLSERAAFVNRLITARDFAGLGLGAKLINWAGLRGRQEQGAKWIRIDVWATNEGLHNYYRNKGFTRCGTCDDPDYPSGALFQKSMSSIGELYIPSFTGSSADFVLPGELRSKSVRERALADA
jgi:GNAT superfamily N-acetyltransferase